MSATPDSWGLDDKGGLVVVQAKTCRFFEPPTFVEGPSGWHSSKIQLKGWGDGPPFWIELQLHQEQACLRQLADYSGTPVGSLWVAALGSTSDYREFEVDAETNITGHLLKAIHDFDIEHLTPGVEPEPDDHPQTKLIVSKERAEDAGDVEASHEDHLLAQYLRTWLQRREIARSKVEQLCNLVRKRVDDQKALVGSFGRIAVEGSGWQERPDYKVALEQANEQLAKAGAGRVVAAVKRTKVARRVRPYWNE